ncbi:hypothetical protein ACTL32_12385 [Planococcus sp. FY231025]|uniref:hypothetical protein n=1 Tax=Planococcus sp. FY231025 TaxID=3455699 RepID=UPI003F8FA341
MKKNMLCLSALLVLLGGCGIEPTHKTTVKDFMDEEGLIRSYAHDEGSGYLSESIGLYMEYLVKEEEAEAFGQQAEKLERHFAARKEDDVFIRWQLVEGTQVNALIDDLRIIGAMEAASEKFGNEDYALTADRLEESIARKQTRDGYLHDFYDWELELPAERITLSYLIDGKSVPEETLDLLRKADGEPVFFPEYYDYNKKSFVQAAEIHMIDQLLIALNRAKIGVKSSEFDRWLAEEWKSEKKLYGRYSRESSEPAVGYESLAVYYYLYDYFQAIGETGPADEVFRYAEKLATDDLLEKSHFFDYIHYQLMLQKHRTEE